MVTALCILISYYYNVYICKPFGLRILRECYRRVKYVGTDYYYSPVMCTAGHLNIAATRSHSTPCR